MLKKNRPHDTCIKSAVSELNGNVSLFGSSARAGIKNLMPPKLISANKGPTQEVKSAPLKEILEPLRLDHIDFFSLDVEGGEFEVLKTMNWSIPVYIICVELNGMDKGKDDNCRDILRHNGYEFCYKICNNEFWINNEYKRSKLLFNKSDVVQQKCQHNHMEPHSAQEVLRKIKEYAQRSR